MKEKKTTITSSQKNCRIRNLEVEAQTRQKTVALEI